jgi:alanyl-tRNA synthetase
MTKRLYYENPGLLEFDAKIVKTEQVNGKFVTILDETAFYPTSGGQPHDTGLLQNFEVIEVLEDESGTIRHITSNQVGLTGDSVRGKIDPERRQYFRQLHTAQHILSRAFINLFNAETVSVHLGEDYGAVELDTSAISIAQAGAAEELANQIIQNNDSIEIIFADEKEAAKLPLRKKPERTGTIRIIKIGELDWSACGGTHCISTAEVILVKVISIEKQRGHALVKFLAGTKAVDDYNLRFSVTDQLTKSLTCSLNDLPDRLSKLSEENKELRRQLSDLQLQLMTVNVVRLSLDSVVVGKIKLVCSVAPEMDTRLLGILTTELAKNINGIAVLLLDNRLSIAVATATNLDAGVIVKQLAAKFSLKGGGNKNLAQLGGVDPTKINEYKTELMAILNAL